MKYYQRLRDFREDFELTQAEVAKLLNTNQSQYARYEAGERELPMHHFITLAKFYNITIEYLVGMTEIPHTLDGKIYQLKKDRNKPV